MTITKRKLYGLTALLWCLPSMLHGAPQDLPTQLTPGTAMMAPTELPPAAPAEPSPAAGPSPAETQPVAEVKASTPTTAEYSDSGSTVSESTVSESIASESNSASITSQSTGAELLAPKPAAPAAEAAQALAPQTANPLIGSWQLVSGRYLDGAGNWVDYQSLGLVAVKVISAGHFSFTTTQLSGTKRTFWAAGSGEYRLEGNQYSEYPELTSFEVTPGQGFRFEFELQGDEWHTRRVEDGVLKEEEIWRRLD